MSIRIRHAPPPEPSSEAVHLELMTARVQDALAVITAALTASGTNRQLVDALLDVRLALVPPARTESS